MNSPFLPEKAQKKDRKRPRRRGTMQSYFVHRFVVQSKLKNIGVFSMIAVWDAWYHLSTRFPRVSRALVSYPKCLDKPGCIKNEHMLICTIQSTTKSGHSPQKKCKQRGIFFSHNKFCLKKTVADKSNQYSKRNTLDPFAKLRTLQNLYACAFL